MGIQQQFGQLVVTIQQNVDGFAIGQIVEVPHDSDQGLRIIGKNVADLLTGETGLGYAPLLGLRVARTVVLAFEMHHHHMQQAVARHANLSMA
ncbi:MAG: hypothetical protein HC898_13080 [Phycisphaerales bacterium]|nr:hypothetical protein [Phycisphaerales bacterium]